MMTLATPNRASSPRMSLPVMVRNDSSAASRPVISSARWLQHIADAADRVDERYPPGVDLLAQVADVELDDVGLAAEVVVPHPVQDLGLGQHPPGVPHEEPEQLELGRGEVDEVAVPADLTGVLVHGQVPDHQRALGLRPGQVRPAEQAAQPGQYLLQAERLGDV